MHRIDDDGVAARRAPASSWSTSPSTAAGSGRSGCTATPSPTTTASPRRVAASRCARSSTAPPGSPSTEHVSGRVLHAADGAASAAAGADRGRQPRRPAARPRQVARLRRDLRHPRRRARRAAAGRRSRRCSARCARPGIDAFLAYGTLLGAVREGRPDRPRQRRRPRLRQPPRPPGRRDPRVVPAPARAHRHGLPRHPLQRAAFKVRRREGDGSIRGLDVFGGFLRDGRST